MKKIYSKFCWLCRALVLLLLLAALVPNNLSAQSLGVPQPKDTTLVSPASDSSTTWNAPIGAYQITNITIAGDGGSGGKGIKKAQQNLSGGKGGGGALISDNNAYTLVSSLRSMQYNYTEDVDGSRSLIFNSITYTAGNGKNGTDASTSGQNGSPGVDGAPGKCFLSGSLDNVSRTDGGANNGGEGGVGGNGQGNPGQPGTPGYIKLTYTILEIPVQIVKDGGVVKNTSILYYDQIGHALNAADSANSEHFFYDEECTIPVVGTHLCLADKDSTVKLYSSPIYHIFSVKAGTMDTIGRASLKAAVDSLNASDHGGTILTRAAYSEVLNETVTVNKDIKIQALGGDITFTRGESLTNGPLIQVNGSSLTIGDSINEPYRIIFDGDSIATTASLLYNNVGGLQLKGKVWIKNNTNASAINNYGGNLSIYGEAHFENNTAENGGAINNYYGETYIQEGATVVFESDSALNGGAIYNDEGSVYVSPHTEVRFIKDQAEAKGGAIYNGNSSSITIDGGGVLLCHNNQAEYGAAIYNEGRLHSNGTMNLEGNIATRGGIIYNAGTEGESTYTVGTITNNVVKYTADDDNQSDNGVVVLKDGYILLKGGTIEDNIFVNESGHAMDTLPASLVYDASKTGSQQIRLSGSAFVDTIRLLLRGGYSENIVITDDNDLTDASEENPIVLIVDTLDKKIMYNGSANNYKKFKPAADTLDVNNQGWLVRKPQITVDGIYLLQAGTLYEDYGITTATGNVDVDKIYVEYTQTVDAHGSDNITTSDSTIIEMNVTSSEAASSLRQKIGTNQINGRHVFDVPFSSTALSGVDLTSGTYMVEIDTLIVHTLGIAAGTEETLEKNVNIPTFDIDTLNFLLAGTKFSDYDYCGVGNSTNDGDGNDVVPGDEIYVQYQRTGDIDTAYIKVNIQGNGQKVTYVENTPANSHLAAGCGSFRTFLDNTGIGQFVETSDMTTPARLVLADDSIYTCNVNIYVKAVDDPYFTTASKSFTYKHDIDRAAIFALDTANDRDENYNKIGIELNNFNDSLALTYPSVFSVAKANELGMIDNTDHCVYVVLTADPVDTVLRVESANQAKNLLTDVALNSSNYSTAGYGVQDGKLLMAVKVSEPVAENAVVVPAINFVTDSVLRWCSVIGANTGVNNPYKTFRTFYKVSGEKAHDTTVVAYNQMSYRKTGVSGVKLHNSDGQASFMYHPEDYTVWAAQDPTPGLNLEGKVWLALYVAAPNANVKQVYSHPATNTPSGEISSVVTLADDLANRVTTTQAVNYYPVGTCANYANKDYTFYINERVYENNYLYWFDENGKLLSVQHFNAAVKAAPQYTVNFNFHGGGATCNVPYSDSFADTTYIFGRPIVRPDDPFKCGHLFMDWRHGVDSFTVDSFKNIRAGIAEGTVATTKVDSFGIRSNMVIDAAWKYFVTIANPNDTAVVAHYSLCEINTRDYVTEPTEAKRPYIYTFHKDYLGKYYRDYIPGKNGNCDVKFGDSVYLESPKILPVGQTSRVTWRVTDMCNTTFTLIQNVNVMFPPCGTDNYDPAESAYVPGTNNHGSLGGEYIANIDSKDYRTVRIGCDCWLKENLQNDQYANGHNIAIAKAYLDDETKVPEFGRLYTWYSAVNVPEGDDTTQPTTANETITFSQTTHTYSRDYVQGICPNGWHIPAIGEYRNLKDVVSSANAVKAVNSNYWLGYLDATDADHFTGIPGGYYDYTTDRYFNILGKAYFWSTENYGVKALPCTLLYGCPEILFSEQNKYYGVSVRCVRNIKIYDYPQKSDFFSWISH